LSSDFCLLIAAVFGSSGTVAACSTKGILQTLSVLSRATTNIVGINWIKRGISLGYDKEIAMIDAEQLLGKVLSSAMQGRGKKKKKKRKKSDDLVGSLVGGLSSGKGLLTAIGLGVGAYEILKQQSAKSSGGIAPSAPIPGSQPASPPPIPGQVRPAAVPAPPQTAVSEITEAAQPLAIKLLLTMVAAAHADGRLDHLEERQILEKLQEQGLNQEEKAFLLRELHHPQSIEELTQGIDDPVVAQTMYSLAVSTIEVDTAEERQWLDTLASALGISPPMQQFIEQELGD
jgi:uncharacterized membrane protein YebE (DUF533 family)